MAKDRLSKKNRKNPGGEPISVVHHQIEVLPFQRKDRVEIPDWRSAHKAAESLIPNHYKLYSLYADVELDGHVEAVVGKRIDPVTNANWSFVDREGKPVEEIDQLIDTIGFEDLLRGIMMSKFWGYKMMEPKFWQNGDGEWEMSVYEVPYLNMRPHLGIISYDSIGDEGINIREGIYKKTIMEVGKVNDLGLYLKAAPYQILKRGGIGDYALFVQVFGMPIVDAQWDGVDEVQKQKLNQAIAALGSGGSIIRPKGTEIKLLQNNNSANGQLQDRFIKALNKEISKALLGTTETTESSESSGYAQGKVHQEEDDEKNSSDENFVRRILNSRFRPILRAHGFDTKGGRFIIEGEQEKLTVQDIKTIKQDIQLPLDDDFLYEKLGLPKPENYDQLKKAQQSSEKKVKQKGVVSKDDPEENEPEQLSLIDKFLNFFSFFPLAKRGSDNELWTSPHHNALIGRD